MPKVDNDHTADEKTSNQYNDNELINFNLVNTATNAWNLSSINKNNSNACDITNANEEKIVEAVPVNSIPISALDNYNKVNLHLVETIDRTTDQFKELIEKARKCTEDNEFTVNDRTHSSLKKTEEKVEETRTKKKGTTLIMGDSVLSQIREDKLCKKGTIKVRHLKGAKFDYFYHYAIPSCTPEKMVDQIL